MAIKLTPDFSSSPVSGASASLKPAAKPAAKAPAPAPKAPAPTTKTPAPTGGGSGGGGQVKQNGGWYNGVQYWAPGQGPQTTSNDSGGGGEPDYSQEISDMYAPAIQNTYDTENYLNDSYKTDQTNLEGQFANTATKYNQEGADLNASTDTEEQKFNKVLESAYADAVRSYNALQQQGRARFGRGNSAGQAIGELAQQEYFRQQGQVQQRGVEGSQQFAQERNKIKMYVSQKLTDLDLYKQQALADLKKNLQENLLAVQARRGDIEANKTRDRLAILESARNQVFAIKQADTQFRQNLALSAVSKMQEVSGRAFTPTEIAATLAEFQSALSGANVGAAAPQSSGAVTGRKTSYDDPFGQIIQGGGSLG